MALIGQLIQFVLYFLLTLRLSKRQVRWHSKRQVSRDMQLINNVALGPLSPDPSAKLFLAMSLEPRALSHEP